MEPGFYLINPFQIPFAIGGLIVTVDAYLIRDWQTLQLVSHVPWLALLVLWFLIPGVTINPFFYRDT